MKKNSKAFTLIELLAVIVIIGILGTLIVPTITKKLREIKNDSHEDQVTSIQMAAQSWGSDHVDDLPDSGTIYITLDDLQKGGYIKENITDPNTGDYFPKTLRIKITRVGDHYTYTVVE